MVSGTVPSIPSERHSRRDDIADDIDFEIKGVEMQFVEIELDPGESAVAEAGSMMFKYPEIEMTSIFGDGSEQKGGFFDKLLGAGKRVLTGESLFTTVFTHRGHGKARVGFASPYPGHILAIKLDTVDGQLICQKDAFLCAAKGVSIGIAFQRKILTGMFGGEGFIMQDLQGDGWVFVHVGGTTTVRDLAPGEEIHIDTGCVAAYTGDIDFDVVKAGSIKSMIFGGEGMFFARLRGPGRVWMQSLPFSRLAGRIHAASPQAGTRRVGEGSILGGIGDIIDGD
ncbi:MAG: AIM24 family protein [Hyphomicrobiales bacterium]|nr:AIM24 family protein [Hyphomicrobiales bacterium]